MIAIHSFSAREPPADLSGHWDRRQQPYTVGTLPPNGAHASPVTMAVKLQESWIDRVRPKVNLYQGVQQSTQMLSL